MRFTPPRYEDIPTVAQLIDAADRRVSGLDKAKRRLALTLRRFMVAAAKDHDRPKQNMVVLGSTGSGKTFLLAEMLKACPVVWTEANATEYSDVGYHGRDLTSMYLGLLSPRWRGRRGDPEPPHRQQDMAALAERWGVVVIDEWDKLRTNRTAVPGERAVGRQLQAELLKLVEGSEALVKHGDSDHGVLLSTHNILHIAVGAFSGIEKVIARNEGLDEPNEKLLERVVAQEIIDYGFLEELVGRFSTIVPLPVLDAGHLSRIFREHVLPEFQRQCADDGIELVVDEGAIMQMGNRAVGSHLGARTLAPTLDDCLTDAWSRAQPGDRLVLDAGDVVSLSARLEQQWVPA